MNIMRPTGKYGSSDGKYLGLMHYYEVWLCRSSKTKQVEQIESVIQKAFEDGVTLDVK